jgi:hypothetical protein
MAKRLTEGDKALIKQTYLECGTYAETARRTGFSASTVRRYASEAEPVAQPAIEIELPPIKIDFPPFDVGNLVLDFIISEEEREGLRCFQQKNQFTTKGII